MEVDTSHLGLKQWGVRQTDGRSADWVGGRAAEERGEQGEAE